MNQTLETLLKRRSVRKFTTEQLEDSALQSILEAGQFAPSAMNQQAWHFTVVQSKDVLTKLNEACRTAFLSSGNKSFEDRAKAENFSVFYNAPTLIIVTNDQKAIAPQHDGSLALGNMLNAAQSLGVSSCWIHALNMVLSLESNQSLKAELGIPEGYIPIGSGAFGYKAMETPAAPPRKDGTINIIK